MSVSEAIEPLARLDRDLRQAARLMGRREVRYLTDTYYQLQEFRKATANQVRSADAGEGKSVLHWAFDNMRRLEDDIKKALGEFSDEYRIGKWLQSICGIGPVISAGLLAHLDIRLANTCGHFWRFAGLDPTQKWEKKQKRPWNADLKSLCAFKAGECFVKFQNNKNDFYGRIFRVRKDAEIERNGRGAFAEQAKAVLESRNIGKTTDAYKWYSQGMLPPAHLHARARRYAVKMFLSHVHHAMYVDYHDAPPPVPYAFEHSDGDHRHFVDLPNWPFEGGGKSLGELFSKPELKIESKTESEAN